MKITVMLPILLILLISLDNFGNDELTLWIQLEINNLHEKQFKLEPGPQTVRRTTEISFIRYGFYTFKRTGSEPDYIFTISPGKTGAQGDDLSIRQTHPCQDGQSLLIGRETRGLSGRIHPASGGLMAESIGGNRMKLYLMPSRIVDVDTTVCGVNDCGNLFGLMHGENIIGRDLEASEEGELDLGYVLTELDWNTLESIYEGGELTLAIPVEIEKTYTDEYEDPPGYSAIETVVYKVKGSISASK